MRRRERERERRQPSCNQDMKVDYSTFIFLSIIITFLVESSMTTICLVLILLRFIGQRQDRTATTTIISDLTLTSELFVSQEIVSRVRNNGNEI
jgi:hypothetical protein